MTEKIYNWICLVTEYMQNMAGRLELCQPLNTSTNVENWDFLFLF